MIFLKSIFWWNEKKRKYRKRGRGNVPETSDVFPENEKLLDIFSKNKKSKFFIFFRKIKKRKIFWGIFRKELLKTFLKCARKNQRHNFFEFFDFFKSRFFRWNEKRKDRNMIVKKFPKRRTSFRKMKNYWKKLFFPKIKNFYFFRKIKKRGKIFFEKFFEKNLWKRFWNVPRKIKYQRQFFLIFLKSIYSMERK